MEVTCQKCNVVTNVEVGFELQSFACPNCQALYLYEKGQMKFDRKFDYLDDLNGMKVGMKGILKGTEYTIIGILVKKVYGGFYWREYTLADKAGKYIYLSEADGHWIILEEVEGDFDAKQHPVVKAYNGIEFDLYDYSEGEIATASGFLDFPVTKKKFHMTEYINPPYILSIEQLNEENTGFFGEHISKKAIAGAFPEAVMPSQTGIGLVQPPYVDFQKMLIIFCSVAILIFLSNWVIYMDRSEQKVLSEDVPFSNTEFISKSFELKGASAPLTVNVHSEVDNSWASVQIALVNDKTNEEVYANKDIEFYHGYSEGESWSEGDRSEKFNICGVTEGKYHLVVTPQKPVEDITNTAVSVNATWNNPSMWNVWMPILFMGILSVGGFILNRHTETKRWEDSNYSPYSE